MEMTDPSEIPLDERRRQYNAINRRMNSPSAKNFPAGLVEKWQAANSAEAKFLDSLRYDNQTSVPAIFSQSPFLHIQLTAS